MDKKNTMLLTVIAVATLLVAVVGATFAYFSVTGTNTSTNTAVQTTADKVGVVSLTDTGKDFYLNLTAAQMSQTNATKEYWASTENVDALTEAPAAVEVATIEAAGGDSDVKYECTFNWALTVDGDADALAVLAADSVLTLTQDAGITGVAGTYNLGTAQTGKTGMVQFTGDTVASIDAVIKFTNTNAPQNNLSGATLTADLDITNFSCDTVETFTAVQ